MRQIRRAKNIKIVSFIIYHMQKHLFLTTKPAELN